MRDEENTEEEVELTPAEDNPWYEFMKFTIKLDDDNDEERGWHWFWGLYFLHEQHENTSPIKFSLTDIQSKISDSHWLKEISNTQFVGASLPMPVNPMDIMKGIAPPAPKPTNRFEEIQLELLERNVFGVLRICLNKLENPNRFDFSKLLFDKPIDFSNFIFPMPVCFLYSKLAYDVKFNEAFFYRSANFTVTKFLGDSNFNNTEFLSSATFSGAIFSSGASFYSTTFADDAIFYKTIFSNDAFFTKATFARIASFDKTEFRSLSFFTDVTFSRGASFTDAIFSHRAIFDQIKITGHTSFRSAEFKQYPPSFHKVDMYSDIIWDEIKWPILNRESNISTVDQNKSAYENLASHMKKMDKHHDEHFFYRKEMQCRGWLAGYPTKCFYVLYERLSDYGYGIKPALWGWFYHILAGIYFLIIIIGKSIDSGNKDLEPATAFWCSIPTSFSNAHRVLSFHNGALDYCHNYLKSLYLFDVIWAIQSILGILFLFLVLLTLRIRFRLK